MLKPRLSIVLVAGLLCASTCRANPSTPRDCGWVNNPAGGGWIDDIPWLAGDFNGDGRTDLASIWNDGGHTTISVRLAQSDGTWVARAGVDAGPWVDGAIWRAGDFGGDGKTDIAQIYAATLSGGSLTTAIQIWTSIDETFYRNDLQNDGGWVEDSAWLPGDFNGDGLTDLLAVWADGSGSRQAGVRLSQPNGTFDAQNWPIDETGIVPQETYLAGDFNGDGKADVANWYYEDPGLFLVLHPSNGSGFDPSEHAFSDGGWVDRWLAGDFNGDGFADAATVWHNGDHATISLRTTWPGGERVDGSTWLDDAGGWIDGTVFVAGDFDGDGRSDIAGIWNNNGDAWVAVFSSACLPASGEVIFRNGLERPHP